MKHTARSRGGFLSRKGLISHKKAGLGQNYQVRAETDFVFYCNLPKIFHLLIINLPIISYETLPSYAIVESFYIDWLSPFQQIPSR